MTAGRRSMTSCLAACSARAGNAAIQATNKIGGRVLEVGVGTGISLPQYAPHLRIFGTDISEAMLRKAQAARRRFAPEECRGACGDGCREARIPRRFLRRGDGAICRHRGAESGSRVGRVRPRAAAGRRADHPASRVSADAGMRRFIEQRLQPVVRRLGFRTAEFAWSRYTQWAAGAPGWNWSSAAWCRRSVTSRWSVSGSLRPRPATRAELLFER